jgi:hypothetical protein
MGEACSTHGGNVSNVCKISVGKLEGKRLDLSQDRNRWQALVNTVMNP